MSTHTPGQPKRESQTYLWHVIHGRQKPGPLILRALGLEAATSYEKSKGGNKP